MLVVAVAVVVVVAAEDVDVVAAELVVGILHMSANECLLLAPLFLSILLECSFLKFRNTV